VGFTARFANVFKINALGGFFSPFGLGTWITPIACGNATKAALPELEL